MKVYKYTTLKVNKKPRKSYCRIILDGHKCDRQVDYRGVCKRCRGILLRRGCLDKYALASQTLYNATYTVNKNVTDYQCRTIVNGKPCKGGEIYSRGLCKKHYSNFHKRGTLEKFAIKAYKNPKRKIGVRDYAY